MKKVFIPFVAIIGLLVMSLILSNLSYSSKSETESKKVSSWLQQMKKKYDYTIESYEQRYIAYQKLHPKMDDETIITHVNMGLDHAFYTNTKKAEFLNTNQVLVNKYYYLEETYIPNHLETLDSQYAKSGIMLVKEAKDALESLIAKAKEQGYTIHVTSAYRSYDYQLNLYDHYVTQDGKQNADTYSARPGFSEHQTGLVVDLDNQELPFTLFEQTDEYTWMQEFASDFGFILRFPKGKEKITGYDFESWHYRYVGVDLAKKIKASHLTFDEYYARYLDPLIR